MSATPGRPVSVASETQRGVGAGEAARPRGHRLLIELGDRVDRNALSGGAEKDEPPQTAAWRKLCERTGMSTDRLCVHETPPQERTSPDANAPLRTLPMNPETRFADASGGPVQAPPQEGSQAVPGTLAATERSIAWAGGR